jgi:threonine dehydratase
MTHIQETMQTAELARSYAERSPAREVHDTVLPLMVELSVLSPEPQTVAREELYNKADVRPTPLETLSRQLTDSYAPGVTILIKPEHTQKVRSYKIRGAAAAIGRRVRDNAALGLPPYVAASANSAGNHIQGVIQVARAYGINRVIAHMPWDVSVIKETAVLDEGAEIRKYPTLECATEYSELADEEPGHMHIPPFDDPDIIAGASTIGSEAFADMFAMAERGEIDLLKDEIHFMLPVGGGGCAAGNAILLKSLKEIGIVGDNAQAWAVQAPGSDAIEQDMYGVAIEAANPHYGGVKVTKPGKLTKAVLQDKAYARFLNITDEHTAVAMELLRKHHGVDVESSGGLSMGGVLHLNETLPAVPAGRRRVFLTITSGANVDPSTVEHFAKIAARKRSDEANAKRLAFLALSDQYIADGPIGIGRHNNTAKVQKSASAAGVVAVGRGANDQETFERSSVPGRQGLKVVGGYGFKR